MGKVIRSGYEMYPHQTVYLQPLNKKKQIYNGLQEGEIILVGQKYVTVKFGNWNYKFDLKTLEQVSTTKTSKSKTQKIKSNYKDWRLFLSKEDYEKNQYYAMLYHYIKQKLSANKETCKLSIETLENIRNIIDKGEINNDY